MERALVARGLCALVLCVCAGCAATSDGPPHKAPRDAGNGAGSDAGDPARIDAGAPDHGYWAGTKRSFARSPGGNVAAVSCHNCYEQRRASAEENLAGTIERLHAAQNDGADLLELDLRFESGGWYVAHDDDGSTDKARLDDVLADADVLAGNQLLFLEIKEDQSPDRDALAGLLRSVAFAGYAVEGRDVVLRAFNMRIEQLRALRELLVSGEPDESARAHFRLQVLYALADSADLELAKTQIEAAASEAFDGVEFNYVDANVLALLDHARSFALGTNVWTFGPDDGTARCAEFRDASDALTTDSPLHACRAAVQAR